VGYTADRGDFMEIECAPFASAADLSETTTAPAPFSKKQLMYIAAAVGAFVLILAIALFVLVRRAKAKARAAEAALPAHVSVAKLTGVSMPSVLGTAETAPALPTAPADRSALRAQAIEIASRDPATAAIILRGWLGAPSSTAAARNP
jgi:flagellar biosynthesis/type III secretory pathway M-ring protein FliF/YscJ